ncbi:MAG: hypothetical protein SGPRY_012377, partial [Prymnesium sp.]
HNVARTGSRKAVAANARREYQQKLARREEEAQGWIQRFDLNRSNKLEKEELAQLLEFLYPRYSPTSEAVDYLITKATGVSAFSMSLKGDVDGGVDRFNVRATVKEYRAHIREQVRQIVTPLLRFVA